MDATKWSVRALCAVLPATLAGAGWAQEEGGAGEEDAARSLLEKAEERYASDRYTEAARLYRSLARKFPDTEAGRIGERRSRPSAFLGAKAIVDHGLAANRVDVAIMGDGYTLEHQRAFSELAEDVPALFERQKTFREYYSYLNFHRVSLVSKDDNVDGFGREEDTALGGAVRGTIQGHVGVDGRLVRGMLDELPAHDGLAIVFVRAGILGTGMSGVATIGGRSAPTTIHEWGHAFARLGDEYAAKTHNRGGAGMRPNLSNTDDPQKVPWLHWLEAGVPGIGVYQGANGQVRGAWKPTASGCVMESGEFFCRPCREALVLRIYSIVDPIDWTNQPPHPFENRYSLVVDDEYELEVRVMTPATHNLEVRWWIVPERFAPRGRHEQYRGKLGDRSDRGPLQRLSKDPVQTSRHNRTGRHRLKMKASEHEPGRYRVICRVRDTTKLRSERFPWVLRDEQGVLESEAAWWVEVRGDG